MLKQSRNKLRDNMDFRIKIYIAHKTNHVKCMKYKYFTNCN